MKQKQFLLLMSVLIVIGIFFALYKALNKTGSIATKPASLSYELKISPQTAKDRVLVDTVNMPINGWVVARAIEGERLSQIIEISTYLEKGRHENITIQLGEFYNQEELIVMIYEDNGDKIFNDIDLPALDDEGRMVARYVKTGDPLSMSIIESDSLGMPGHSMPGMVNMVRVHYTDQGFVPSKIEISVNNMVEFVNDSNTDMWVASNEHPEHGILPTFDQFKSLKKGAIYRYTFDKKGSWGYHDHINAQYDGIIEVK